MANQGRQREQGLYSLTSMPIYRFVNNRDYNLTRIARARVMKILVNFERLRAKFNPNVPFSRFENRSIS